MRKNKSGFDALRSALNGLPVLFKEKAVRRELILILIATLLLVYQKSFSALLLVTLSFIILAFEAANTAVEMLCDHITPHYDLAIKAIKDVMAGAILILSMAYFLVLLNCMIPIFL